MGVRLAGVAVLLACAAAAHGQAAATADGLQGKLAKLAAASEDLEEHLPSFACKETLVSRELRGKKVKTEVRAAGELRVMRDPTGKLNERFEASEMNGRPITPDNLRLPMFVSGGFRNALDFLRADLQMCFRFSIAGNRLNFDSGTEAATPECAKHTETRGFALLSSDGDIVHMERQVPVELAQQRNAVPFGSIDLNRTDLGGKSFLLSTHVRAEIPKGKSTYRWEATYSDCRLYSVSVTIGPATLVDPDAHGSGGGSGPTNP